MLFRCIVSALFSLAAACCWADERPNILFILSDDHTSQAWGVYDSVLDPYIDNPSIARLADEGTLLRNAFCDNSICTPSRATILTGQRSHRNGVYTLADALDPSRTTVATILQGKGYQTALFGKWHLKKRPSGFDEYKVLPGQGRYWNPVLKGKDDWQDGRRGGSVHEGFSADVIGGLSLDWLRRVDRDRPFFLVCSFKATHEPFDYPDRHAGLLRGVTMPEPPTLHEYFGENAERTFLGQRIEILGERYDRDLYGRYPGGFRIKEEWNRDELRSAIYQKFVKDFLRSGKAIDDNIGRLLDHLDEAGLSRETVVIYTADQGYFLGEHGMMDKRIMYEEPLRMPFVIRYDKEVPGGVEMVDMIQNIDFAPLLVDYAGLDPHDYDFDGRSFRQNLRGDTPLDWREEIYYRYWQHEDKRPAHFGIRTKDRKLIHFHRVEGLGLDVEIEESDGTWEYYDLVADPTESDNLYGAPGRAAEVASMKQRLAALRANVESGK